MLQRAASNAYSWWWASHIRTKQSKWLDNNLEVVVGCSSGIEEASCLAFCFAHPYMEVKVQDIVKLIEEDGDSFAQKAEMYYRKRPELIKFVEEFYRAYRSLAERYDHISGELHKANNTIATVFPDQIPMSMDDDDDFISPKASRIGSSKMRKAPKDRNKTSVKKDMRSASLPTMARPTRNNSQMDKYEAQGQIDKLQKGILVLQTEKEFIKNSYESNLAKYWDIEKRITEMQHEVCCLQDDYSVDVVIEDDDARALMAATALKSCEDTLINLQEQQKRSAEEARTESERIMVAKEKLKTLKGDEPPLAVQEQPEGAMEQSSDLVNLTVEVSALKRERLELQSVCNKIKKHFEMTSDMSVEELAEKIDVLVDKVVSFEVTVSSQTALIKRLRLETDELHKHLQNLEEEKMTLTDDSKSLNDKLKHAEAELIRIQNLDKSFQDENQKLQSHFTEACHNFNDLSEKLQSSVVIHDATLLSSDQEEIDHNSSSQEQCNNQEDIKAPMDKPNSWLDDLTKETSHGIQEPDFCLKDQDMHTHSEENCALDNLTEEPRNSEVEDQKTNSIPEDVTRQLVGKKQEDNITDAECIPGDSTANLTEFGQEDGTSKNHIPDAEQEIENEIVKEDLIHATESNHINGEKQLQSAEQGDSPNWQKLFLDGLEDREKLLLAEYTSILRNFKETKRRLSEAEKKNQEYLFETMSKMRDLKNANAMKDEEIRSLRKKLQFLESSPCEISDTYPEESKGPATQRCESTRKKKVSLFSPSFGKYANEESSQTLKDETAGSQSIGDTSGSHEENHTDSPFAKDIELHIPHELETANAIEEKFRRDIDEVLEENLEFWLRFSSSFQQIQKFQTALQELQSEIAKLKDTKKQEGSTTSISSTSSGEGSVNPEATPIYKQLRDLQNDLSIWLDQNAQLKVELEYKFSSLCQIKDEISKVSTINPESAAAQLTAYQAAKFHGEVLNMQQENNKVADELQTGMDHVKGLEAEVEQIMAKMHQNFELSASTKGHNHLHHLKNLSNRTKIPLRSFLFGTKPKPKKPSIFSCMNPALQKQYSDLTAAIPP
ncbi:hypothetical protein Taro_006219 [Colocasia esculenta]|uniref:NAB domain-containing protein n=1 Tax=Colocasia esculenta TaxID=4460 RepID=A0A843TVA8_COLES|nr:hypothetical protein [Colocasia esculenta]